VSDPRLQTGDPLWDAIVERHLAAVSLLILLQRKVAPPEVLAQGISRLGVTFAEMVAGVIPARQVIRARKSAEN